MLKYVVFDFDGTLVDSREISIEAVNRLADRYRFKRLEQGELEKMKRLSLAEKCRLLKVPLHKLPMWASEFYKLYRQAMNDLLLFDGIKELLDGLNGRGYRLAVISSNSEQNIRDFLTRSGVDYISQVFCSNNVFGKDKIIRNFLHKSGLKPSEVIYVGDEQRDIVACKRSGIKVIWVDWGLDTSELAEKENPDYSVSAPGDILRIVEAI